MKTLKIDISHIIKFKCLYYKFYQLRGLLVFKYNIKIFDLKKLF